MNQFLSFVRKEFAHVLRDRRTLLILFGLPVVQILNFGFALTNEVKNARILMVDYSNDVTSTAIIRKVEASQYFDIEKASISYRDITTTFNKGDIKLAIVFPANFGKELGHTGRAQVQIIADASDPNTATTLTNYVSSIISDYQLQQSEISNIPYRIGTEIRMLYNPQLQGVHNFVPGVMALVLFLVCVMMTAISIVREKEIGTMEVLLVSPFKPILVIVAKMIPYLALSLINVVTILLLSVFVLQLPVKGSVLLLFAESILFIITCLTLGLLISVRTHTQEVAMLISLVGMLLPTIVFSGFMFPIENMPRALQWASNIVPSKWYYIIVKSIMIKGLGFSMIWRETLYLLALTLLFAFICLRSFKIRLA